MKVLLMIVNPNTEINTKNYTTILSVYHIVCTVKTVRFIHTRWENGSELGLGACATGYIVKR